MHIWFERNSIVMNAFLTVLCVISYMGTMNLLVFYTHSYAGPGNLGGVFHFVWFGQCFVEKPFFDAQQKFFFFDFTSYLITSIIAVDTLSLLYLIRRIRKGELKPSTVNFALRNVLIATLCLLVYAGQMNFVSYSLKRMSYPGGVINYAVLFVITMLHTYQGRPESSVQQSIGDFALWAIMLLFISTLVELSKQMKFARH